MGTVQATSMRGRTLAASSTAVGPVQDVWNYRSILFRTGLVVLFATAAHHATWEWLRFATSEIVLRLSGLLDIRATRVSFDVIELQGEQFQYLVSCTFVDVFFASIPLIWNVETSLKRNCARIAVAGMSLTIFNAIRLEIAVLLYLHTIPWTIADGLFGGFSYFIVWLVIWYTRSWCLDISCNERVSRT